MDAAHVTFLGSTNFVKAEEAPAFMERLHRRSSLNNLIQSLEDCRRTKDLARAKRVHMEIKDNGLDAYSLLGNPLVQLYVECGSLPDAQQVFDSLVQPNEPSWTSLIVGYIETGNSHHAFHLFDNMQDAPVEPSRHTYISLIKACSKLAFLDKGREFHSNVAKDGFESDLSIGNTLVDMYGKCDSIVEAREVFDELSDKDVVSWNALISGYADHLLGEDALMCFEQMQSKGVVPDDVTFLCSLKACASIGALRMGQEIHTEAVKEGYERHSFLGCTLVDMYAKCGLLVEAQEVFDELPSRGVVSWTVLIAGYVEHGHAREALSYFDEMQRQGFSPNVVTFVCSLKACGTIQALDKGQELHVEIAKEGLENHPHVNSNLVDMYAKCGFLAEAREVFDELHNQDIVSWTTLIAAYADNGHDEEALKCLEAMRQNGMSPNVVTLVCSLKACCNIGDIERGRDLHREIVIEQLEGNSFAINSLVGMYAKCDLLGEAWDVFEGLPSRDIISWNAMILGCAEQGENEKALTLSAQMQEQGWLPDNTTFVSVLKAVGNMEAFDYGKRLHAQVFRSNQVGITEMILATAFIDMYCKCGSMSHAQQVFNIMQTKDHVLWTALMTGYTQHGENDLVFHLYDTMREGGLHPNEITFLSLFNVCSHSGLVDRAYEYLEVMRNRYGIEPNIKHLNCVADLLGRAGQIFQAVAMLEEMPVRPSYVTWSTILGHCRNHSNAEFAKFVFECAVSLDDRQSATFILMSNVSGELLLEDYEEGLL